MVERYKEMHFSHFIKYHYQKCIIIFFLLVYILNITYDLLTIDTSLKDGLFHEFKKHGKVTSVQIHGASEERYGLVFFRQQEDQEKALGASKGKLFFGMQIDVTAWSGPGKF